MNGGEGSIAATSAPIEQQVRRQGTWSTADVKYLIAHADPGKCRKDRCKRLGIAAHVTGIGLWRDDKTHRAMLCRK